jgi:hypothetical protein
MLFNKIIHLKNITCRHNLFAVFSIIICFAFLFMQKLYGQTALQAWGNITGIRVEGELMRFESRLCVVGKQWTAITSSGQEKQSPKFSRDSTSQFVTTRLGNVSFTETVTDLSPGKASVAIRFLADSDTTITGTFFCLSVALKDYGQGTIQFGKEPPVAIAGLKPDDEGLLMSISAREINLISAKRQLKIQWQEKGMVMVREGSKSNDSSIEIYLPLQTGNLYAGQSGEKIFSIQATGMVDKKEIHLILDTHHPGRVFAGFGGNFRIQNLKTDPGVIDYCLNHMRVAWGRVEMPWRFWQPEKNNDPVARARAGRLDVHVQRAMEMAQKLQQRGIPIILTAWSAPNWAIIGKPVFSHRNGEPWGNPLNPDSITETYRSIADYIFYLQDQYSVQVRYFSFNESDLGINVRQTGEQHAELIKGLGKYFLSRGLKTKLLLGDNSDATTFAFIDPALRDTSTHPYIGAVSFHSWRGWDTETLSQWTVASQKINLPLIVGEGSIDAAAWAYPAIFLEQSYALEEINLYIRLMAICQPVSILQWQLTADYSPLTGGGIFGKEGPLEPTQRFWNLKQLASTPEGLQYFQVECTAATVTCAALGSAGSGKIVLHIVNNGSERKVIITGIPAGARSFKIFSTSKTLSMVEGGAVAVRNGMARFILPSDGFTTLISQ